MAALWRRQRCGGAGGRGCGCGTLLLSPFCCMLLCTISHKLAPHFASSEAQLCNDV